MSVSYRFLGNTGVKVTRFCMGTMTFGTKWEHVGFLSQKETDVLVGMALDAGINFFDTADVYHNGESEEFLAKALGDKNDDVIVATKVRGRQAPGPNEVGLSRRHIQRTVEASLKRLRRETIDLLQVHGWDQMTPLEETLSTLNDLVRTGKVRYIGASNYAAWQIMKALAISDAHGWERFVTLQPLYNLMNRELELEHVPLCLDQKLGILPWSPLAAGFLTGKYRKGAKGPEGARRAMTDDNFLKFDEEKGYEVVAALEEIGKAHGGSVAQAALNWVSAKPGVTSVIIGARSPEQLKDNLHALEWELTPEEVARLDELTTPPRLYPYWFIEMMHRTR